jgi:protein-disulfide isomerase
MFNRASIWFVLVPAAALSGAPATPDAAIPDPNPIVAAVDGQGITFLDFARKRPTALFQAENAYFEAEKKAVDAYLDDYLLERQAQKENVTVEKLLEIHVNGQLAADPSDESLKVYWEGLDTTDTFEAMRDKIKDHLRERRLGKLKQAYVKSLRDQAQISLHVAPPRAAVAIANAPVRGAAAAPLTLVEFADYECPYCQQIAPDLLKAEADYKGKIKIVFKDMPLPMHPHAQKASEAAHCAGAQNKYWEYHDYLFNSKELEVPQMKADAKTLGLDVEAFDKCLDSGATASVVKTNLDEAIDLGLSGTPSFFLNGRFVSGSLSYDQLRQLLDEELKATSPTVQQDAKK